MTQAAAMTRVNAVDASVEQNVPRDQQWANEFVLKIQQRLVFASIALRACRLSHLKLQ